MMAQHNECITVKIPLRRYDDLIRAEAKYNLLRNALEECEGYISVSELKKHFGIPQKIYEIRKENEE